jgi:heme ABC exporter ATP-binding subunit CcmA
MGTTSANQAPELSSAASAVPALEAVGLTKRYGSRLALAGVSLQVAAGECLGVFGANGAGKSTLLRILATLVRPTSGRFSCYGLEMPRDANAIRRLVGVVAHQTYLVEDLTVWENLEFYARLYTLGDAAERIREVLHALGLAERARERVRVLSRGQQQRLSIARAVLHRPSVLLLDEPDTGLDREGRDRLVDIVADQLARGGVVVMATHAVEFGSWIVTRALFLERGRLLWERPADEGLQAELDRALRGRR